MAISLIKEEERHILRILPVLLRKDVEFKDALYDVLGETFTKKDDFAELKGIVKELADAQKETEKVVKELGIKVEELADAQKETEKVVKELGIKVEELADAQKETEKVVQDLGIKVSELAEAQKRTEIELRVLREDLQALTKSHKDLAKQVGGISHTIGYELEEKFYPIFPKVLKEDFGVEIETHLERKYLLYPDGKEDEINIYAEGRLNGKKVYLIGESKAQLGKGDIDDFAKMLKRVKNYLKGEILPILLCYIAHPKIEKYQKETYPKIKIYKSYELKRRF